MLAATTSSILGEMPLTAAQVTMLTDWVNGGGNLIAMRPDKKLAPLLGLDRRASATLANGYLLVNTARRPGAGIVGQTIQFHGTADRYTLNGATQRRDALLATPRTATTEPGGHPAQRRRAAAARRRRSPTTSRDRSSTRARATRPGRARSATASRADPLRRPVLRRRAAMRSRLGRPRQGRDPAGRRAAAAAGEPDRVR